MKQILLMCLALTALAGCGEATEQWINARIGLKEGVCEDGEFQYFPPDCIPNGNKTTSSNGETQ